ncbi:phage tail tape measure protein [Deinococcus gobiensis]|uniref:Phage tail tape measure protein, family, core region domain protein n=1 Tax=Deinococcus gobiensis (strain DSM 21396 / JCM 16679 / CGMCC 1.7299 / I-0) TaxID=745776 RepID=H8H2I2_DEIGI|nr:phage tail tape measure protein [Deinococcus gobiensis]AFD27729.1 Phage tail tape measure protein, family, core region domain protein [Deinococcus gobiensis I-0]
MTQQTTRVGSLGLGVELDFSTAHQQLQQYQQRIAQSASPRLQVQLDTRAALSATDRVRQDIAALGTVSQQQTAQQVQATRILGAQYEAARKAIQQQNAATVAASRADQAAAQARTAQLREQQVQLSLNLRLAEQQRRAEQQRSTQTISALDNEQRSYRNLWRAQQISADEQIAAQRKIHEQALLQAAAVDKTTDAYRRLTQIAANAQHGINAAQGINTPGGLAASIQQGVLGALGNLGPFGALLEQVVTNGMMAAQQAAREGAQHVAAQAGAGLRTGLAAQSPGVQAAAANLGQDVQQGAQAALDIRSPSRVMHQIGVQAGQGLVGGLNSQRAAVTGAAAGLGQAVQQGAQAAALAAGASGGGVGGSAAPLVATLPSAQANLRGVATQAALTTLAVGGTALALGVLGTGLVNGAKKAAEYQQGLADISTLTDKLPGQLGKLGTDLLKMTVDTGKSFTELKKAYEEIQGASVRGTDNEADALTALERMATLAKVTKVEAQVSADAVTSLLNAYGMDITQTTRVSDLLWTSVKAGKVQLGEIARSLGSVAGQAKGLNVPIEELLGAMAMLTTRGIPASTALEYIRSALSNVQKPSIQAKETAKALGIEFSATALKSMGLIKFLDQMGSGVGDNSEALSRLIGDVGGLQAVMGLLQGGLSDSNDIMRQLTNSTGQLDEANAKLKGTAVDAVNRFHAAWDRTQILFSGGLLNTFTNFLDKGVNPVLKSIGDMQTKLDGMKDVGEIKAVLKIDWAKDDPTTMAYKLFVGGAQGTKEFAGAAAEGLQRDAAHIIDPLTKIWNAVAGRMRAEDLQGELQRRGVIERPTSVGGASSQLRQIQNDMPGYQALLVQALNRSAQASEAILQSIGRGTATTGTVPAIGPLIPGQSRGEEVSGLAAVGFMGLAGRNRGTPYGQTYGPRGSWGRHNGEDWFAPTGTEIKAAFTGYVSTRWSDTTGHLLEITDAKGQKILLGHLDRYAAGVEQAVKAAGGRLLVQQGQLLAYVGQTGSLAHKDLGPGNAHVHVMGYDARGRVVDPMGQSYTPVTGTPAVLSPAAAAAALPTRRQSDAALIAEARRILTRVEERTKAGDLTGKLKAEGVLAAFEKGGPRAAGAIEVARLQLGQLNKETSKFGQGYDALSQQLKMAASTFKVSDDVPGYIRSLDAVAAAAGRAAEAERRRNGDKSEKYQALKDLQGDAVDKARSQREAIQREEDRADKDAATRNANRLKSQQAFTAALAAGSVADAQRALDSLKDRQQEELALYTEDAAKRAQVIERTGPQILAASDKLINLQRDQKVRAARQEADEALKVEGADPVAVEGARREAVRQAYRQATADRAAARRAQASAERTADLEAEKAAEQARANRLAADRALADGQLDLARKRAQAVVTGYDDAVKAAGDSARAQLDVEERLGRDVLAARNVLSTAEAQAEKTRLERERNAAVNVTGLTLRQRQDLWRQYGARIAQVDQDLQATLTRNGEASAKAVDAAWSKVFSDDDVERAKAYTEKVQGILASIPGQDEEGLIRIYTEAQANRDTTLMNAVFDEWEKRREAEEAGLRAIQKTWSDGVAADALTLSNQLQELGDNEGAVNALQVALGQVMDAAQRGEDAGEAVNSLTLALNNLGDALGLDDQFNTFVAQLSGTLDEQVMQVADQLATLEGKTDAGSLRLRSKLAAYLADLRRSLPDYGNPYAAGLIPGASGFQTSGDASGGRAVLDATSLTQRLGTASNGAGDGVTTDPDGTVVVRVKLEDEGDLNRAILEATNLLDSELGQSLPEGVRKGLEDAVAGAQAYKDALISITGEGVADGASEALKNAAQPPKNLFAESAQQIFDMQASGDLTDPVKVGALRQALDTLRQTGGLTDVQLANLNATIDQLTSNDLGTVNLGKRFDLSQWQKDIQDLSDEFDAGWIDAGTYTERLGLAGDKLREYAAEAEAAGNPKLAQTFRDQAAALRAMNPQIAGALLRIGKVQEYAGYVQQAAGAFGQLASAIGQGEEDYDRVTGQKLQTPWKDLAANLEGVGNAAGKVLDILGDVAKVVANPADIGAWISLVTKVVSSVADAIAGFQKARAEVSRLKAEFTEDNPFLNADDYQKVFTRSRGWFADTFGGGPEVVNEIDKIGLTFAKTMQGAFASGIKKGLTDAIRGGDINLFSKALHEEVYGGLVEGMVDVFLNEELLKNIIAPAIKAWSDALKTPDTADDAAALAGIDAAVAQVDQQAARFYSDVAPKLQGLQEKWGLTPEATQGVDTTGLSTAPPAIQYALSTPLLEGITKLDATIGRLDGTVGTLGQILRDGIPVTVTVQQGGSSYQSTTGALAGR